jgi:hypothetical protein
MEPQKIITQTEEIWITSEGITYCKVLNVYLDLKGAENFVNIIKELGKGEKLYVLVDLRMASGASQEARNYLAKEGAAVAAMAFWTPSALSRMLGNFFLGFSKPIYPTKLFTEEKKGLNWLKAQQINANTGK